MANAIAAEAERAVARARGRGATESPSAYELDRRRFVLRELKSRRVLKALVIGALRRIAERLRSPAREEVLLLAARRLAGLRPERRAFWAALLAPLYPEERRARATRRRGRAISALPELGDRLEVLTERLLGDLGGCERNRSTSHGMAAVLRTVSA